MDEGQQSDSHLFTVRVWVEKDDDGRVQYRGKLHHIPSGAIRHFRAWAALIPLILDILRKHPYPQVNVQGENQATDERPLVEPPAF